jgi:hypothetical protein
MWDEEELGTWNANRSDYDLDSELDSGNEDSTTLALLRAVEEEIFPTYAFDDGESDEEEVRR